LLLVRDLAFIGPRTYKELLKSDEGIATNILADRLEKLRENGIVEAIADPEDGRRIIYRLTKKGIDLTPVLVELIIWAADHEGAPVPRTFLQKLKRNRTRFLAEIRQKWHDTGVQRVN
jgi:DNA-binding HxlR family transcriptional regulator